MYMPGINIVAAHSRTVCRPFLLLGTGRVRLSMMPLDASLKSSSSRWLLITAKHEHGKARGTQGPAYVRNANSLQTGQYAGNYLKVAGSLNPSVHESLLGQGHANTHTTSRWKPGDPDVKVCNFRKAAGLT